MDHPINQDWLSRDGMPVRIASGTGPYQCRLQAIGQDGVPVDDSGITDTLTAYDLNGAAHAVDEIVWVKPSPIPDGDGRTIYLIQSGAGGSGDGSFWARVASSTQDSPNKRWTYTINAITKYGSGFLAWTMGSSLTAYNTVEAINEVTGTFGNGVASTNLVGSFTVKPAPEGAIVRVYPTTRTDNGSTEYWFAYENAIDGACP
jgi:hypothetical protein